MVQRPSIKQPKPLNSSPAPQRVQASGPATAQVLDNLQAEISAEAAPLWKFVLKHARVLALGVVGVVALIVGVALWQWYAESNVQSARQELGRIVAMQDPSARLSELETFATSAPRDVSLAAHMELAAAAVQMETWETAAAAYSTVINLDKDSALALAARLGLANVQLRQGKAQEALTSLDAMLAKAEGDMVAILNQQIAEAAEAAGQNQRAIAAYEAIIAALPPSDGSEAAFYQSRISSLQ